MEPTPGLGQPPEPPTLIEQLTNKKEFLRKQLVATDRAIALFEAQPDIADAFQAVRTLL